ncbi:putative transcriptional regulatory protein [Beauveria bassiana]|nr:putative transcriptional regulatory protein [Beauveria bassiana]
MPEEEEEVSAVVSQHDGSSGDEARDNASTDSAGGSKKRKRGRYQKTSNHAQSQIELYAQDRNRSSPASAALRNTPSGVGGPPSSLPGQSWDDGDQRQGRMSGQGMNVDYANVTLHPPRIAPLRRGPSSLSAGTDLPPQDIVYTLVDLYFKHCNTWSPILDRKTTFTIFFGSTSLSEADRVLLHAIVATTLRFLKDSRFSPEMRAHYHETSRQIVQMYAMEHVSVEALRALVIVCLDELGTSNGPRGWNLLTLLAQNARQLSLCEESSVFLSVEHSDDSPMTGSIRRIAIDRPQSWIEDEGRRRLAWMVYLLDRYATIATTTFDFMLDDTKMKRVLPCSYDLFSRDIPVETRSWGSSPDQHGAVGLVVNKPDNLGTYPTVRSHLFVPSHYAMQRCLSAVQSLGDIAQDVYEASGLDHLGPPFIFSLWVAARLLLVHAATTCCPVDPRIEFFIEILGHVGQYWEVADNYAKVLARVVQRGRQGDVNFNAMRQSAHGLVTLAGSTRLTGIEPTSTHITSLSELDNIDVFDFFNYPKISDAVRRALSGQLQSQNTADSETPRLPDPESDWLGFTPQGS